MERVVLIFTVTLLLFVTPVIHAWAQDDSPWFLIYLLWLVIILLGAFSHFTRHDDDF